jgi:hypothetical protein
VNNPDTGNVVPMRRPAPGAGCGRWVALVPLGLVLLVVSCLGGCSVFVQNQVANQCALREVFHAIQKGDYLAEPLRGGYPVLVTEMHNGSTSTGDFVGATYLTPIWGANGFGVAYISFNSVDNLTYNYVGANFYMAGKTVALLPFRYSGISKSYLPWGQYTCP